ncbi:DUF6893 family small protein [Rhodococcus sp. NPDC127528]
MKVVGEIATAVVAIVLVAGIAIGITSIPDIKRYLRIRHM